METWNIIFYALILLLILVIIGILGFMLIFNSSFIDSFYQTLLIMGGLSLEVKPQNDIQKIFIGVFAFLSIACYLSAVGVIIALYINPLHNVNVDHL